jgi:hypothetical protein
MCADILAQLDLIVTEQQGKKPAWKWQQFEEGNVSLNVRALLDQLEQFKGKVGQQISEQMRQRLLANHPDWQGGAAEDMLDWILTNLTQALVDRNLDKKLMEFGIQPFFEELAKAADDNGGKLDRQELSRFFVDEVLRPSLLYPVRKAVRSIQGGLWIGVLAVVLLPVGLMRLLGLFIRPSAATPTTGAGRRPPINPKGTAP